MVQKYQSPVRVYKYPFELVMAVSYPIPLFSNGAVSKVMRVLLYKLCKQKNQKRILCLIELSQEWKRLSNGWPRWKEREETR